VAVSFIGWGNKSTRWKPPTCRKSLTTHFIKQLGCQCPCIHKPS
jgi:hypothetical protein